MLDDDDVDDDDRSLSAVALFDMSDSISPLVVVASMTVVDFVVGGDGDVDTAPSALLTCSYNIMLSFVNSSHRAFSIDC